MKIPVISRSLAFEKRATVNPQVSLLDLTLEAGIPGDVMWSHGMHTKCIMTDSCGYNL